jgi:hypothetical protein
MKLSKDRRLLPNGESAYDKCNVSFCLIAQTSLLIARESFAAMSNDSEINAVVAGDLLVLRRHARRVAP